MSVYTILPSRDQYSEILMKRWVYIFNEIFDEDNYTPMLVDSQPAYDDIVSKYPFKDEKLEQVSLEIIYSTIRTSGDHNMSLSQKLEQVG